MQSATEKVMTSFQLNQIRLRPSVTGAFFFIVLPGNEKKITFMQRIGEKQEQKKAPGEKRIHGRHGGFAGEQINKERKTHQGRDDGSEMLPEFGVVSEIP